ncbi:ABC transporter ATP-binding protein/permease [Brucepastera parasyntrophica]|uniref:ABC transporter ATP-binding protein n=1 Tax=Brucepastera parasyntrophica TaxID=2880008 RepID=UPI00210D049E|nr:ABC transporter ATP-binding protein [Brucepastera parasyntrophica]ULQ59446.1 ABC transporter ATP-binding protein/permease [Brucepastera parasyntrophica]
MIGIFRKFFRFAGKQAKLFYQSLVISLFHAIFEALRIPAIAVVLGALLNGTMTYKTVLTSLGIMLVSIAGCTITRASMTMKQTKGGYRVATNKRIEIGERLRYMPMGYFNDNSLGYITSVTTNTAENLQDVATRVIMLTTQGILTTAMITLAVLIYDWRIGLLITAGIAAFFGINALMQNKSRKVSPLKTEADSHLVEAALEYIQGIAVVRSCNLDQGANKTVDKAILQNENINFKLEKTFVPFMCVQSLVLKFFGLAMILLSIIFYFNGTMALMNCLLLVITSFMVYSQLDSAGNYSALLRVLDLSMDKINEVFETPVMDIGGKDIRPESRDLAGKDVDFSYQERKTIDKANFAIPEGTTTAIVGPSGGGKTTLCRLLARFWDVDSGSITLGDRDVREYTLDSLLENFSMVFQNVYLFNDTIANNIKFGKPDADDDEVREAARRACCHDFIAALPEGYNTVIGEGGATLSGGEKQRVSIARALLKDAPVIILDEATANVDPENEALLQEAIAELTRNKTIIMIAHRLKTVQHANQILVLDRGRITQRGTHDELMKAGGLYADFITMREKSIGWKLGGREEKT